MNLLATLSVVLLSLGCNLLKQGEGNLVHLMNEVMKMARNLNKLKILKTEGSLKVAISFYTCTKKIIFCSVNSVFLSCCKLITREELCVTDL